MHDIIQPTTSPEIDGKLCFRCEQVIIVQTYAGSRWNKYINQENLSNIKRPKVMIVAGCILCKFQVTTSDYMADGYSERISRNLTISTGKCMGSSGEVASNTVESTTPCTSMSLQSKELKAKHKQ